ncbi:hypothetical protein [Hyphomonas sp.]|uniref:PKD domain-containing protein n=1 Tax=Hyphomonas sp. TaxID=87 RepID=UPI0025BAFBE2|nr:hypothetical protein [Hyphomonas sp.]
MRVGIAAAIAALGFLLAACGGGGGGGGTGSAPGGGGNGGGGSTPPPANRPPVAAAGPDFTAAILPAGYQIDGSASTDPDGNPLSYVWSIVSQPAGANATISGESVPIARLMAMAPGDYVIRLRVVDPAGAENADTVTVTLTNDAPVVSVVASEAMPAIREEVLLDASGSNDVNGHLLTYSWRLTSAPSASALQTSFEGAVVPIEFDAEGEYTFEVSVSDGYAVTTATTGPIQASLYTIRPLNAPFRMVAGSAGEGVVAALHERSLMVLRGGREAAVTSLPLPGLSIAVSPNGHLAAIGHETSISVVDLSSYEIVWTLPAYGASANISIADDGYVYAVQSEGDIFRKVISISPSGLKSDLTSIFRGSQLKMHPSGEGLYSVDDRSFFPDDIRRISVSAGHFLGVRDSPYHGQYSFCGNKWLAGDGRSILTACGVIVESSSDPATDMRFLAMIDAVNITNASYNQFTNYWSVLTGDANGLATQASLFGAGGGKPASVLPMPRIGGAQGRQLYAKYVWSDQASDESYILAQDDLTQPQAYYILKYSLPSPSGMNLPPVLTLQKYSAGRVGESIRLDAGDSFDPEGRPLQFAWTIVSQPAASSLVIADMRSAALNFTPAVAGTYVFSMNADDGVRTGVPQQITVNVAAPGKPVVFRLDGIAEDGEYSKALDLFTYFSPDRRELRILRLDGLGEARVPLSREGYRIGLSFDGRQAYVAHTGLISRIDLETAAVIATQQISTSFGDIVLDRRGVAHMPNEYGVWNAIVSVDMDAGTEVQAGWATRGDDTRMHPNGDRLYTATRRSGRFQFDRWDLTTSPISFVGSMPQPELRDVEGPPWFREDGAVMISRRAELFHSSDDPATDMVFIQAVDGDMQLMWAEHSSQRGVWALAVNISQSDPSIAGKVVYYSDTGLEREGVLEMEHVPLSVGTARGYPRRVFFSGDGDRVMVITDTLGAEDRFSLQIAVP